MRQPRAVDRTAGTIHRLDLQVWEETGELLEYVIDITDSLRI